MPRARGISRLNIGPPSPRASTMISSPTLRMPLSSALAMALFEHLLDHPRPAMRHVLENVEGVVGIVAADQVQQRAAAFAPRSVQSGASRDTGWSKLMSGVS